MPLFLQTAMRRYSARKLERSAPRPPAPFVVSHGERSSLFRVTGRSPTGEEIHIHAQLPTHDSRRPSSGIPAPLLWSAAITRGGFTMDLVCSTLDPGLLCIDGMAFYNSPAESCEHAEAANRLRRTTYQGPLFHNGALASFALGIPVVDTVNAQRQSARNWYNPYQGTLTKYTKFDHMPVHTIDPDLCEAALQYAQEMGVTDDMAAFMAEYAAHAVAVETERWCDDILAFVGEGKDVAGEAKGR